jgi:5-methylcytosine-specific restriction protein A
MEEGYDFVLPTVRKRHSPKVRREVWIRERGICYLGNHKILPGTLWHLEHPECLADGGTDDPAQLKLACEKCHRLKTGIEATRRAKEKRVFNKHFGVKEPKGRPIPGSRRSPWKRKINGKTERRD